MKKALIVFIKKPQEGKVKTRLGKKIGDKDAVKIYTELLAKTFTISKKDNWDTFFFSDINFDFNEQELSLQIGDNLGQKMYNAFKSVFEKGYNKVSIIGSDCFELSPNDIKHSFEALNKHDFVMISMSIRTNKCHVVSGVTKWW